MAKIGDPDWCLSELQKSDLIRDLKLSGDHYNELAKKLFNETEKQMRWADMPVSKGQPHKVELFDKVARKTVELQKALDEVGNLAKAYLEIESVNKAMPLKVLTPDSEPVDLPELPKILENLKRQATEYANNHKIYLSKWESVLEHCFLAFWVLVPFDARGNIVDDHPDSTRRKFMFASSRNSYFVLFCGIVLRDEQETPLVGVDSIRDCLRSAQWYRRRMKALKGGVNPKK